MSISIKSLRIICIALICAFIAVTPAEAQKKDRQLKRSIKKRAVKEARKEARRFKRQDYFVAPGALPMSKQIQEAWKRQYDTDEVGAPLYLVASGNAIANTRSAAKLQATELAKLELAGAISTQVSALIESNISNEQFNQQEANSVTKTLATSNNVIMSEIGRTIQLLEIYRTLKNKNTEAAVRIAYSSREAITVARQVLRKKLEEETDLTREKLERLLKSGGGNE